jgi:hypothetical protein
MSEVDLKHGWAVKLIGVLLQRNHSAVLGKVFIIWRHAAEEVSHYDAIVQRIVRRWQLLCVASCFSTWNMFAEDRKYARKLASRVFGRILHGKCASAWATWVDAVADAKYVQAVCEKAAVRLSQRGVLSAFLRWSDYVHERQHMRHLVSYVLQSCRGGLFLVVVCGSRFPL